ncbi:MAG: hypothetical protein GXP25_23070 [Planctomycetes bacterium]|nr:hypothetical protein [Planctomycetota bacterium]
MSEDLELEQDGGWLTFPWRGVALGSAMSIAVVVTSVFFNTRLARQGISNDFLAACAMFFLVLICLVVNPLLRLISPRAGFSGPDLLVAFAMALIASAIPSWGLVQMWVCTVTGWQYFQSPENQWGSLFIPYIPKWAVVTDPEAIRYLYEGLPPGVSVPWQSWAGPVFFWFTFFIALHLGTISLMVLFRRLWVEHERLAFPMMQFGAELCKVEEHRAVGPFFRDRMVWYGAAVPFVILSYNALSGFFPNVPQVQLVRRIYVLRRMVSYTATINFPAMGFAYLVGLDVSLGLWLFHVLGKLQVGIIRMTCGAVLPNRQVLYCSNPLTAYEGFGTMIVLFVGGIWVARKHLGKVFWNGLLFRKTPEDRHEIMSYRAAVWAFLLCFIYMIAFLHRLGLALQHCVILMIAVIVIFYCLTRIICEAGVGFARGVYIPNAVLINQIGTEALGVPGVTALGFTSVWSGDLRTIVMTQAMQGMRLTDEIRRRRPMLLAFMLASILALSGSLIAALAVGYKYGLYNGYWSWPAWPCGFQHWNWTAKYLKNPRPPDGFTGWLFIGIGAGIMWLLMFLRHTYVWWPVHYIGLPICLSLPMTWLWFSVFLAWTVKVFILKLASQHYGRSRMFFLGMIFGSLITAGFWTVLGVILHHPNPGSYLQGVTLG